MSRMPPVPSASKPVHGPEGVPKTSTDVSRRVRHQGSRVQEQQQQQSRDIRPPVAGDDLGGAVPAHGGGSEAWMLVAFGAVVTAIVWLVGQEQRAAR